MRKNLFFLLLLGACILATNVYAEDTTSGFVMSIYGHALKGAYGDCVHTAYYDPDHDKREECGNVKEVASAPVEKPQTVVETVTMSDAGDVLFNFDVATLTPTGITKITTFGKKLGSQPDITSVTIDGYTDAIGSAAYNLKLSANRAAAVKQFFIKNGVPAAIITTHGYGEKDTKVSNACMNKYGNGDMNQIRKLETMLGNKKYKSKRKRVVTEKKQLQLKLHLLEAKRNDLIACAASDRRVVFTIAHNKQVEKTVMVKETASAPEVNVKETASAPAVDENKLDKPSVDIEE